jgi:hypothetical protein
VADATVDPRFDPSVARATGYLPSTLLAAPLADDAGTVGVLEALDRRGGSFTLRDLDVASALAREATIAVRARRVRRATADLLRDSIAALLREGAGPDGASLDEAAIDELVTGATAGLDGDDHARWQLVDRIARLRDTDPASIELAIDWLDALIRRAGPRRAGRRRAPRQGTPRHGTPRQGTPRHGTP